MTAYASGTLVKVQSDAVFAANGFDDNDRVTIVLDGYLKDNCHKLANAEVKFDQATGTFLVTQYAMKYEGLCLPFTVPFFNEVDLGILPEGDFVIATYGATKNLNVKEAPNSGQDEFMYAPVESVIVEHNVSKTRYFAEIRGRFTNTCMKWKEVQLIDSGDSKELLPKVELEERADCKEATIPFSWIVDLPLDDAGRYLLHVRSMNGKAVNHMYSVWKID
jgi:hypothetical protein